ncbi:MAG: Sir2 family NAD-dependent protein deacetylase [Candidatus Neomarinimicrobiota bacterium]
MKKLLDLIKGSEYMVALTGAGISTLSGIKDFRGKDGINKTMPGEKIFDLETFYQDPGFYYKHARDFIYALDGKKPNIIHKTLADWEKECKLKAIITQNIDLLHQKAGSKKVIEIHGSPAIHHCITCYKSYSYQEVCDLLSSPTPSIPCCEACGGALKPDITFYGEALPEQAISDAIKACQHCDLMLIMGTSLLVYPAASLPNIALDNGAKLVIMNAQRTHLDNKAVLKYDDLETVFS